MYRDIGARLCDTGLEDHEEGGTADVKICHGNVWRIIEKNVDFEITSDILREEMAGALKQYELGEAEEGYVVPIRKIALRRTDEWADAGFEEETKREEKWEIIEPDKFDEIKLDENYEAVAFESPKKEKTLDAELKKDFSIQRVQLLQERLIKMVEWLHSKGVAHCDLKLDNLMMDGDDVNSIQFIDFGQCKSTTINDFKNKDWRQLGLILLRLYRIDLELLEAQSIHEKTPFWPFLSNIRSGTKLADSKGDYIRLVKNALALVTKEPKVRCPKRRGEAQAPNGSKKADRSMTPTHFKPITKHMHGPRGTGR